MKKHEREVEKELARSPATPEELERLRRAGFLAAPGEAAAALAIAVFAKRTLDAGGDLSIIAETLCGALVDKLRGVEWHSKLSSVLFSPVVMNPAIAKQPDKIKKRRGGSAGVSVNIEFESWRGATDRKRMALVSECLAKAFRLLVPVFVTPGDLKVVLAALEKATKELQSKNA